MNHRQIYQKLLPWTSALSSSLWSQKNSNYLRCYLCDFDTFISAMPPIYSMYRGKLSTPTQTDSVTQWKLLKPLNIEIMHELLATF